MTSRRPKLAAIATTYFKYSHAQHIVDRFLYGYGWGGTHHHPEMDLVSLYVDQIGKGDLSRSRAVEFPTMKIYSTVAEALTLGTGKLSVDGVVTGWRARGLPEESKRARQNIRAGSSSVRSSTCTRTADDPFRSSTTNTSPGIGIGRSRCTTRRARLGFAFMAGSSLPVTWRIPSVEISGRCSSSRSAVRLLRRDRQLRLSRTRDGPVHGGTAPRWRERRPMDAGVPRGQLLDRPARRLSGRGG